MHVSKANILDQNYYWYKNEIIIFYLWSQTKIDLNNKLNIVLWLWYFYDADLSCSITLSSYKFTRETWVRGAIESDGFHREDHDSEIFQAMTIHIANGTSLFANLVDAKEKLHPYAERIEAILDKKNPTKFVKIAEGVSGLTRGL